MGTIEGFPYTSAPGITQTKNNVHNYVYMYTQRVHVYIL
jgi:hypothetical protein